MSKKKRGKGGDLKQLTQNVLNVFYLNPDKTFNYKQVARQLFLNSKEERKLVLDIIQKLCKTGKLKEVERGKYKLNRKPIDVVGRVEMTNMGYAYVVSENLKDPIFVSQKNLNRALDGDIVKVSLFARKKSKGVEGEVIEIIERARDSFVGVLEVSSNFAFLVTDNRKMPYDIFIPLEKLNGAKDGQKAIAKIVDWPDHMKNPIGEIIEVLGDKGDNEAEMHAILAEFGLPWRFPEEVDKEAEKISDIITEEEIASRRDFRDVVTFTIDPEDAKDFDDALSIRKIDENKWEVGIHIADVTYYVKPGTLIDKEASQRGTSVYLVDRTVPMLPERLSNYICSLRPNEDKLCFSAVFILNENAKILDEWFGRTIIRSKRRFNYKEVQKIIDTGEGEFVEEILTLHRLAQKLRSERFKHGSIAFERDEVKFELNEKGEPIRIFIREYGASNQLIEEFMLLANKRVANLVGNNKKKPVFVYRIHDKPNIEKLKSFAQFVKKFGYKIDISSDKGIANSLNKLLISVRGKQEQDLIENLALRAMAKAIYSTKNIGHYGLGFTHYTHFTSPIRRYPDMMVHRILSDFLEGKINGEKKKYEQLCKHSSQMEQLAVEAERASVKYKQVEFMKNKIGETYDGIISGVTEWGIYVEVVENMCEGMIHLRNLKDDFYIYDEKNYCIIGKYTKRKFQLGDPIKVKLINADIDKKQLDFILAN